MSSLTTFLVQCSQCEEIFPIEVELTGVKKDEQSVSTLEETCPSCDTLLHFEIPGNIGPNSTIIKGLKPPRK